MFRKPIGTWISFALIFLSTYIVGKLVRKVGNREWLISPINSLYFAHFSDTIVNFVNGGNIVELVEYTGHDIQKGLYPDRSFL